MSSCFRRQVGFSVLPGGEVRCCGGQWNRLVAQFLVFLVL